MRTLSFFQRLRRLWVFLRDPRTGNLPKTLALLGAIYILSPIDLIPGLPGISWIDDALVFYILFQIIEKLMPNMSVPPSGKSAGQSRGWRSSSQKGRDDFIDVEGRLR